MLVITVAQLKGGTTKTTTTAHIGQVFHESGLRTLGVDADGENQHLLSWQKDAEFAWSVIGMPVPNIHKQLPGIIGDRYDAVVIDTPPMQAQRGTVASAARIATHLLVPMAPTPLDYDRLDAVVELLENDVRPLRADDGPELAVLLTKANPRAASTQAYRELITGRGITVLPGHIPVREPLAQSYGLPIKRAANGPYGRALEELLKVGMEEEQGDQE